MAFETVILIFSLIWKPSPLRITNKTMLKMKNVREILLSWRLLFDSLKFSWFSLNKNFLLNGVLWIEDNHNLMWKSGRTLIMKRKMMILIILLFFLSVSLIPLKLEKIRYLYHKILQINLAYYIWWNPRLKMQPKSLKFVPKSPKKLNLWIEPPIGVTKRPIDSYISY